MDEKLLTLKKWIDESDNIVFFGGAGVSTESGIPDFRSTDGLYSQKYKYPPETIVSHTFLTRRPEEFFDFYKEKNGGSCFGGQAQCRSFKTCRVGKGR